MLSIRLVRFCCRLLYIRSLIVCWRILNLYWVVQVLTQRLWFTFISLNRISLISRTWSFKSTSTCVFLTEIILVSKSCFSSWHLDRALSRRIVWILRNTGDIQLFSFFLKVCIRYWTAFFVWWWWHCGSSYTNVFCVKSCLLTLSSITYLFFDLQNIWTFFICTVCCGLMVDHWISHLFFHLTFVIYASFYITIIAVWHFLWAWMSNRVIELISFYWTFSGSCGIWVSYCLKWSMNLMTFWATFWWIY